MKKTRRAIQKPKKTKLDRGDLLDPLNEDRRRFVSDEDVDEKSNRRGRECDREFRAVLVSRRVTDTWLELKGTDDQGRTSSGAAWSRTTAKVR
jgi:hypothetical protein